MRGLPQLIGAAPFLALAAACSAGAGGPASPTPPATSPTPVATPTPAGTTVTSDDGKLALFIPEGAMPAGTRVSITSMAHADLPAPLRQAAGSGAGYRLQPDGLTFTQPATATLTLSRSELDDPAGAQSAYALVSFSDTEGRQVLDSETTATLGSGSLTVTAPIRHFSYVTRTKGSLHVDVGQFAPNPNNEPVGSSFERLFYVSNARPEIVTLTSVQGTLLVGGVLRFSSDNTVTAAIGPRLYNAAKPYERFRPVYVCSKRPGVGTYGIHLTGISHVTGTPPGDATRLAITVDDVVHCVEGTATPASGTPPAAAPRATVALPTATPAAGAAGTATPAADDYFINLRGSCVHLGGMSRIMVDGTLAKRGVAVSGAVVELLATGPGLIAEATAGQGVAATATTASGGGFMMKWDINTFGVYNVEIRTVRLSDGSAVPLEATSARKVEISVYATTCPGPG